MGVQVPLGLGVAAVLSQTCSQSVSSAELRRTFAKHVESELELPIWILSGPTSKTLTMRLMKLRMVLKFMRPMLQEPSTSSTMSALAEVLHWASAAARAKETAERPPGKKPAARQKRRGGPQGGGKSGKENTTDGRQTQLNVIIHTDNTFCFFFFFSSPPRAHPAMFR